MTWFRVEDGALDDPRVALLALRLGVSPGDAFMALCRVWRWLYQQAGRQMRPEEVDVVGQKSGLANAMIAVELAEATPEGIRIKGDWRARKLREYRESMRDRAMRRHHAAKDGLNGNGGNKEDAHASAYADAHALQDNTLYSDSGSGSGSGTPDSGARARNAEKRAIVVAAAGAWLEWFNRRFERCFTCSQSLQKSVGAILARGHSETPDMRGVALYLRSQWEGDERMERFLVPVTILRPSKFDERLDLAKEWDRTGAGGIWQVPS